MTHVIGAPDPGAPDPDPKIQHPASVITPAYYGGADNPYEAIKVIEAWKLNFSLGSVLKYICRAGKKNAAKELEDLLKAQWYLRREIEDARKRRDTTGPGSV